MNFPGYIRLALVLLLFMSTRQLAALEIPEQVVNGNIGRELDGFLHRLEAFGFSGSVLVAQEGEILLHKAYGMASIPDAIANHTNTLFSTGSVTKQFTAAGIMALESEGKLSVKDPISKFFADVPPDKRGITIHQLLTHTAGFPPQIGPDDEYITRDQFVAELLSTPLDFDPGEKYQYSNAGYSLAAAIIEIVSGKDYESYLQEKLFRPAGLEHTGLRRINLVDTLVAHSQNAATGYKSPAERPAESWYINGCGGILSTPADLYRWHLALKNNEALPNAQVVKLFTPYVREHPDGPTFYGYGWVVQQSQRRQSTVHWHNGGATPPNWGCAIYHYTDDDAVFIVFVNNFMGGENPVDGIALTMSQLVFGEEYAAPPESATLSAEQQERLSGIYQLDQDAEIQVACTDHAIILTPSGQAAFDLLFPNPLPDEARRCNALIEEMINLIQQGDFAAAAAMWDIPDPEWIAQTLKEWWSEYERLGEFKGIKVLGTRIGEEAFASFELSFTGGAVQCRTAWHQGKCAGITEAEPPVQRLIATPDGSFTGFTLMLGKTPTARITGNTLTIDNGLTVAKAMRRM